MGTPVRSPLNSSLTPIRSPRTQVPEDLIVTNRLCQIASNVQNEQFKYKTESHQALAVINLIQVESSRLRKERTQNSDANIYNDKLQMLCEQLQSHVRRLNVAQNVINKCLGELQGLKKLSSLELQSRSWSVEDYIKHIKYIMETIDADMLLKHKIMEEVAHSMNKADYELHRSLWEYSDHHLLFRSNILAAETNPL